MRTWDFSRDGVRRSLEESLERLGLDSIDVALIHDPDTHWAQAVGEAFPALAELRDQGVVKAVGVGMNQWPMLADFVRETDVDTILLAGRYTLLDQSAEAELLPLCQRRGVSVVAGGVFNSGLLARHDVTGGTFNYAPAPDDVIARAREIAAVCERHGVTLPQAAMAFPLRHPAVTTVLVGMKSVQEVRGTWSWPPGPFPRLCGRSWGSDHDRRASPPLGPVPPRLSLDVRRGARADQAPVRPAGAAGRHRRRRHGARADRLLGRGDPRVPADGAGVRRSHQGRRRVGRPDRLDVADVLAELREGPGGHLLVGIRHQVQDEPDGEWLARPDVVRGLRAVASAGLAYDLLVLVHQLGVARKVVADLPEARFVLDHAAKPPVSSGLLEPWATEIEALSELDNVACKISGLVTEASWTDWTLVSSSPTWSTSLNISARKGSCSAQTGPSASSPRPMAR